jgi:hypothetical protein
MKTGNPLPVLFLLTFLLFPVMLDGQGIVINDDLTLTGQIRIRSEFDGKDFDNNSDLVERSQMRTRLGILFTGLEKTDIFLQIQDSRNLGTNSAGLINDNNLGIHQAYIKFQCRLWSRLTWQIGRFESRYGRERLIGAVGWHNVGRSFDGLRLKFDFDLFNADLFLLKVNDRSFDTSKYSVHSGDENLYGLYTRWLEDHLHLFILADVDHSKVLRGLSGRYKYRKNIWTAGMFYQRDTDWGLDIALDAAYQFGSHFEADYPDVAAYMIAAEIGYQSNDKSQPRIALGFDIASGDELQSQWPEWTDNERNSFYNLFYTGHAFRGYMDYFITGPQFGLSDWYLKFSFQPADRFELMSHVHYFLPMNTGKVIPDNDSYWPIRFDKYGFEFDLTGKMQIYDHLTGQLGMSLFLPNAKWLDGMHDDLGTWFYLMFTANI